MPRKLFQRWVPSHSDVKSNKHLRFLGAILHDPNLFHLNRRSVSLAFALGLFLAFLPFPFQIPTAAVVALVLRCNLPLAIALIWLTNPLTMPFVYYATYKLGAFILQVPEKSFAFEFTYTWFKESFLPIWKPLLLGCLITSTLASAIGFLSVQWGWRYYVVKKWQRRKLKRRHQIRNA